MEVGVTSVDFLGVTIHDGKYQLQPHLGKSLFQFSDGPLNTTQLQQFLGIVSYMAEFIPHQITYTGPLYKLLKKSPPPWMAVHTKAIQALKRMAATLPPLHIPSHGTRILQTDASNE
ncbi:uncharacterized protein LOC122672073 [Telopea speciosissima]|uniref:uncharacterized protein LOC122672073 n=1 Tax=Telopea speciosissima TaxID=54955 RepID=UPI001CC595FE|nr:uncharacterized protein LOC122672073 [Telopea speciosissima]